MKKLLLIVLTALSLQVSAQYTSTLPSGYTPFATQMYYKISAGDTTFIEGASGKGYHVIAANRAVKDSLAKYVPLTRTLTINGTSQDLSANRTWNVGTVTSITPSYGLTPQTAIISSGVFGVDTTVIQTVLNFFPKGDTRWLRPSTASSTYQLLSNLSTDLTASATKYPSVNAVNAGLGTKIGLASLSATSPIFYNSGTGVISSQAASETLPGHVDTIAQSFKGAKTFASPITVGKVSGYSTITFPSVSNDPSFIRHKELTADVGLIEFSAGDNNTSTDGFVFGHTEGGSFTSTSYLQANGEWTSGSWKATPIADAYISSAAIWNAKAPLASPTFTGVPSAPTATAGTNTTQLATTAFVTAGIAGAGYEVPLTFSTGLTRTTNTITINQAFTPTWTAKHAFNAATTFKGVYPGGYGASLGIFDFTSGSSRWFSNGINSSTNGRFTMISLRSDDSNSLTIFDSGLGGAISFPAALSGTGDRLLITNATGFVSPVVIGSGLSLTGSTLTATGGSSGTVTATGMTAGYITKANSASDIGNSVISQSGSAISIAGTLTTTGNTTVSGQVFSPYLNMTTGEGWQWGADASGMYLFNATDSRYDFRIGDTGNLSTPGSFSASNFSGSSSGTNTGDQNLAPYATLASPTFTGTVSGITASMVGAPSGSGTSTGTNTGDQNLAPYATLASPSLTGTPTAPTAIAGTSTTQVATTAFVDAGFLKLSGGTLTGALLGTSATFSGTVTATGGFFNSDIRWKDVNNKRFNINELKSISYTWNKLSGRDDGRNHYGYSAQDVERLMPDAIFEDKDGFKSVNYTEVHTAKIQQLENIVRKLEKEVRILKRRR